MATVSFLGDAKSHQDHSAPVGRIWPQQGHSRQQAQSPSMENLRLDES